MTCSQVATSAEAEPQAPATEPPHTRSHADRTQAKIKADEVLAHIPALRIYARSLCRDATMADDLVQDALVRAIGAIAQFRPGSNLKAWLFTILRNCFYSAYALRRRELPGATDCVASLPVAVPDGQIWSITRQETGRALARMPSHYSEALILVTVLGSSYIDAARILNCDIGTVKSRINRARAKLREELGDVFTR
ncbi:sigma-70 family RNA polymerase sigma factor [Falsigemmobacter faecalis]|uniref:RNA polymerase sigma factor n=1 Tax=Falsigemmobacter faecalis TaxID=2488730 RepID=A0A3P3DHN6_9RHOB|nr:sigma-70 family RNA polymerase sigma factor [Falsigemmobacter faecalis]RRH73206.1 sigma-70 family RNA polymerase sigma factor [Falsigemmobacter faecalis]